MESLIIDKANLIDRINNIINELSSIKNELEKDNMLNEILEVKDIKKSKFKEILSKKNIKHIKDTYTDYDDASGLPNVKY